ncbi:hypothetical protein FRC08_004340 [Ceratobasidium sp. 394]|nr:hypothetical protein FRC08_004340 [Ceratobasidium sp. 394]
MVVTSTQKANYMRSQNPPFGVCSRNNSIVTLRWTFANKFRIAVNHTVFQRPSMDTWIYLISLLSPIILGGSASASQAMSLNLQSWEANLEWFSSATTIDGHVVGILQY